MQGNNGFRRIGYVGPNPPFGTHRYHFFVFTLDTALDLKPGAGRRELMNAMKGHILQIGLLEGRCGV
jgi:Raf kinase inhibitor-like YbhB/YbcL family protein